MNEKLDHLGAIAGVPVGELKTPEEPRELTVEVERTYTPFTIETSNPEETVVIHQRALKKVYAVMLAPGAITERFKLELKNIIEVQQKEADRWTAGEHIDQIIDGIYEVFRPKELGMSSGEMFGNFVNLIRNACTIEKREK